MPLEAWSVIVAGATFVVIGATAIAAVVQLRHLRASNQLTALLTLMQMWNSPELQANISYVRGQLQAKLNDPEFISQFEREGALSRVDHPELLVADFWEQIGSYVKYDLMDERSWLDTAGSQVVNSWDLLEPIIIATRRRAGDAIYENFEYIAVRARLWVQRHPDGFYPPGNPRMKQLKERADNRKAPAPQGQAAQ